MGLRTQLRRHRKDTRLIVGGLGALLLLFSGLFYLLLYNQNLEARVINNRVLLFALWYANVVLILAVLMVLFRIVFKILLERKMRILGSKFKTKLIATYIGLSLFPVLLLFFFANQLLNGSMDRWFSVPLKEDVLSKADELVAALNQRIEDENVRGAARVLGEISSLSSAEIVEAPQLGLRLQELLDETALDILAVYEGTSFLRAVISPRTGLADLPELEFQLLRDAQREGKAVKVRTLPGLEGVTMLAAVSYGTTSNDASQEESPPLVVVAATIVQQPLAEKMQDLRQLYQSHRQLVVEKDSIKASHLLLFLMATLLILLASTWVGLYLARRVTVPIQALAAGTRQIMGGDLGHRVAVDADDELGVLVDSFNQMTTELEQNRDLLEQSNRELMETSRQQAEERALIAAVLQNVAAGVMSFDREETVFTCNGAARNLLHLREKVLGLPAAQVLRGINRSKLRVLLAKLPEGKEQHREQVNLVVGGEWKSLEVTITPIRDGNDQNQGSVMVFEDLTDLIKAQKLAAWTEAARRIAHEIKNPLTPIRLSAERLLRRYQAQDPKIGEAVEDAVDIIVREVTTLQGMVDEFSRYARMPYPHPQETDFAKLVNETLDLYHGIKPGVEVEGEVTPGAEQIWVDTKQFKQALINLLDNAVEATEAPGRVVVRAEAADGRLRLSVADTGRGIPDADKEKLFLPYFSTKGRGTGLGLAIVHRIVTEHHGRIRVEANHPQGTVFTIDLPAA